MKPSAAEELAARANPINMDITGQIEFTLKNPTAGGHHHLIITAGVVDEAVMELLGGHQCHRLAAAMQYLTGWDIITIDAQRGDWWGPVHSVVQMTDGSCLDIWGRTTLRDVIAKCRNSRRDPLPRPRHVPVEHIPGDVLVDIDHLRGDPMWWTAEGPIELVAVLVHFARLLTEG